MQIKIHTPLFIFSRAELLKYKSAIPMYRDQPQRKQHRIGIAGNKKINHKYEFIHEPAEA
jgi:hypothetical protein